MFDSFKLNWRDGTTTQGFKAVLLLLVFSPFILMKWINGTARFSNKQ